MFDVQPLTCNEDFKTRLLELTHACAARTAILNRPQADLVRELGTQYENKNVYLMSSGNGAGKTTVAGNIITNIAAKVPEELGQDTLNIWTYAKDLETGEEFPGFFNYPFYQSFPKDWPKTIWYISDPDGLKPIHEKVKAWFPKKETTDADWFWTEEKGGKHYTGHVEFLKTGWHLFYKSFNQPPTAFETADVSIIIFDEPPPESLYYAAISRLRTGGVIIIAATPLKSGGWFQDRIVDRLEEPPRNKWHQQVNIWQNCLERAGNWEIGVGWKPMLKIGELPKGNLKERYLLNQIAEYPEHERKARVEGQIGAAGGLVITNYPKVREQVFRPVELILKPEVTYMYRFTMDPHDRKPPACGWFRQNQWGKIEMLYEFPNFYDGPFKNQFFPDINSTMGFTIKEFIEMFLQIERDLHIPHNRISDIIDPNFGLKPNSVTGNLFYQDCIIACREVAQKLKMPKRVYSFITDANDALAEGHEKVREWLRPQYDGDHKFAISSNCVNTDQALRRYSYLTEPPKTQEKHGLRDRVEEKYKDFVDVIRYTLMAPWTFRPLPVHPGKDSADYGIEQDWREQFKKVSRPEGSDGV